MPSTDSLIQLIIVVLSLIGLYLKHRSAKTAEEKAALQEEMLNAVIKGVHDYKRTRMITTEEREELDSAIKAKTNEAGVEDKLKPIVKKVTNTLIQIPKLALLVGMMVFAGCSVNPAINQSAQKLRKGVATLQAATVRNPKYDDKNDSHFDPNAQQAIDRLWKAVNDNIDEIDNASR